MSQPSESTPSPVVDNIAEKAPAADARLSDAEQARLDQLLGSVKKFHNLAIIGSALAFGLTAIDPTKAISLPLGVQVPVRDAITVCFLLTVGFTAPSFVMMREAINWVVLDPRRPPFAWFPLAAGRHFSMASIVWLLAPVVLASFGMVVAESWKTLTIGLLVGVGGVATPIELPDIIRELSTKTGEKGEPISFTSWLTGLAGGTLKTSLLTAGIFALLAQVPRWKMPFAIASACFGCVALTALLMALLVVMLRRPLDRFGNRRLGFVLETPDVSSIPERNHEERIRASRD